MRCWECVSQSKHLTITFSSLLSLSLSTFIIFGSHLKVYHTMLHEGTQGNLSVQSLSLSDLNAFLFFLTLVFIYFFLSANAAFPRAFSTSKYCFFHMCGICLFSNQEHFFLSWNRDIVIKHCGFCYSVILGVDIWYCVWY